MKARTSRLAAIEAEFAEVWETLGLPRPTFKDPEELTEWERLRPTLSRPLRQSTAWGEWLRWGLLRRENPFHPRARPEVGRRLRRRIEFERASEAGEPPWITDAASAERALRLLRGVEPLCREADRQGDLVVCLAMQAILLAGSLGRPEVASVVAEELSKLAGVESESPGVDQRVRTALDQLREFLRDPFREADLERWRQIECREP